MYGIRVLDENCKCIAFHEDFHNNKNVLKVAGMYGTIENMDMASDCITIVKYADGKVLGFSI